MLAPKMCFGDLSNAFTKFSIVFLFPIARLAAAQAAIAEDNTVKGKVKKAVAKAEKKAKKK